MDDDWPVPSEGVPLADNKEVAASYLKECKQLERWCADEMRY